MCGDALVCQGLDMSLHNSTHQCQNPWVCITSVPQARSYLNKLPKSFAPDDLILVSDVMLATGGTIMQVGGAVWGTT